MICESTDREGGGYPGFPTPETLLRLGVFLILFSPQDTETQDQEVLSSGVFPFV